MKIAIPTSGKEVNSHFGKSEAFTIYTLNEKQEIENQEVMPSEKGCGCKSNLAEELAAKGVTVLLAGNMGQGAVNKLKLSNIEVFRGYSGEAEAVLKRYLSGDKGTSIVCDHHDHQH